MCVVVDRHYAQTISTRLLMLIRKELSLHRQNIRAHTTSSQCMLPKCGLLIIIVPEMEHVIQLDSNKLREKNIETQEQKKIIKRLRVDLIVAQR